MVEDHEDRRGDKDLKIDVLPRKDTQCKKKQN